MREGLSLAEERGQKLLALREMVNVSIERSGQDTDDDIELALNTTAAELAKEGY
jgi:hypothetical protein